MRHRATQRRGTIYIIVLGTSLVIATLGLAALTTVRVERSLRSDSVDSYRAQFNARAGAQMGLYQIANDSAWRTKMASNTWNSDLPLGQGTYGFYGVDPIDSNLTNSAYHPVRLTSTGKSGPAMHKVQCEVAFHRPGLNCLEGALYAGGKLTFINATVNSATFLSAGGDIHANGTSQINADVKSSLGVFSGGGTYNGTTIGNQPLRQLPNAASLIPYYDSLATAIDINQLPFWDADQITNGDFENGITGWTGSNCVIVTSAANAFTGISSLLVNARLDKNSGPIQDATSKLQSGETYTISAWIFIPGMLDADSFCLVANITSSGGVPVDYKSSLVAVPAVTWTQLKFTTPITWTGTLTSARFSLESTFNRTFHVDQYMVQIADAPASHYAMHRRVLSPASNPFGPQTNAQGVYKIDCGNKKISVRDCRIEGVLVLLNQGAASKLHGSLCCSPAVIPQPNPITPTYPLIVSNQVLSIETNSNPIDEGQINANLNPAGTPHRGVTNTTLLDTYPSEFSGIIYSQLDIDFANSPSVTGMVVSEGKISVQGQLNLKHAGEVYYQKNAPEHFQTGPVPFLSPGSFKQVLN